MKKPVKKMNKLATRKPDSDMRELFVAEYCKDFNASAACVRAGYSAKNSDVTGAQLLVVPSIREAIDKRKAELLDKVKLQQIDAWTRLRQEHEFDPGDLIDDSNLLRDMKDIPPERRKFLKSYKVKSKVVTNKDGKEDLYTETEVTWVDPSRTTDKILKATGILSEDGGGVQVIIIEHDSICKPANAGMAIDAEIIEPKALEKGL